MNISRSRSKIVLNPIDASVYLLKRFYSDSFQSDKSFYTKVISVLTVLLFVVSVSPHSVYAGFEPVEITFGGFVSRGAPIEESLEEAIEEDFVYQCSDRNGTLNGNVCVNAICASGYANGTTYNFYGDISLEASIGLRYFPSSEVYISGSYCDLYSGQNGDIYVNEPLFVFHFIGCTDENNNSVPCVAVEKDCGPSCNTVGALLNPALGSKYHVDTDLKTPTFTFNRWYNSRGKVDIAKSETNYWTHSYSQKIIKQGTEDIVLVARDNGQAFQFIWEPEDGVYESQQDVNGKLEKELNPAGDFIGWEYTTENDDREYYDDEGKLIAITNIYEQTWTLDYALGSAVGGDDNDYTLDVVTDPFGRTLTLTHDANGVLTSVITPDNKEYQYTYTTGGLFKTVVFPDWTPLDSTDNRVREYHYEHPGEAHLLTGITDERDKEYLSVTYDSELRAQSAEYGGGARKVELDYLSDGKVSVTTTINADDPGNIISSTNVFDYHYAFGVRKLKDVTGGQCLDCGPYESIVYDANGNIDTATDYEGITTDFTFNSRNLEEQRIEAFGTAKQRTITTQWHPDYRIPTVIDEAGMRKTTYTYYPGTARLQSLIIEDLSTGEMRTISYTYTNGSTSEPEGLLDTIDGPRTDVSDIVDYDYDSNGNLIKVTNPIGNVIEITQHDAAGRPKNVIDENGNNITLNYHIRGWLNQFVVNGIMTKYQYTYTGQLWRITQPSGRYITYHYDDAQRLDKITDNEGNYIKYILDAAGNRIKEQVFDSSQTFLQVVKREYDKYNRMTKLYGNNNTNGWNQAFDYDDNGNLEYIFDGYNNETITDYDVLDRPEIITDRLNGITSYEYDALGYIKNVTDPRGLETSYIVNAFGDVKQIDSPDTGVSTMTYDAAGNLKTRTDSRSITLIYNYDAANNLTGIVYPDGNIKGFQIGGGAGNSFFSSINAHGRFHTAFQYDAVEGQEYSFNTGTYRFNDRGQVTAELRFTDFHSQNNVFYDYDDDGNLKQIVYPSGRVIDYEFDTNGRVNKITSTFDGQTEVVVDNVLYRPFGPVVSYTTGGGIVVNRSLDYDGRLSTLQSSLGAVSYQDKSYHYDKNNNIDAIDDLGMPSLDITPGYDLLDRLDSYQDVNGTQSFLYDANGNRVSETDTSQAQATYGIENDSNRIETVNATAVHSYDAAGNLTGDGQFTYHYNADNRLQQVKQNGATVIIYSYDSHERRTSKRIPGNTRGSVIFVHDLSGRIIEEQTGLGRTIREYVYLGDLPVAMYSYASSMPDGVLTVEATGDLGNSISLDINLYTQHVDMVSAHAGTHSIDLNPIETVQGENEYWDDDDDQLPTDPLGYQRLEALLKISANSHVRIDLLRYDDYKCSVENTTYVNCGNSTFEVVNEQGVVEHYQTDTVYFKPTSDSRQRYDILSDHLGTPQKLIDQSGLIAWSATYDPFGKANIDISSSVSMPLRYPGQYYDEETGLHYNWHRYYDPELGRYISSDPIGLLGGINTYAYAELNPIGNVDPLGLSAVTKVVKIVVNGGDLAATFSGNLQDVAVLSNPSAPPSSRILAAVSLASEFAPVSLRDAQDAYKYLDSVYDKCSGVAKKVHGNSKASTKEQHLYMIQDADGNIKKIGVSGQKLNKNGTSPRANSQLKDGDTATVLESGIPGRANVLQKEGQAVEGLRRAGHELPDQKRPKI